MDYKIFTDAAADLDKKLINKPEIEILPMSYSIDSDIRIYDGEMSEDGYKEFYSALRKNKVAKTTHISENDYEEYFSPFLEKGESILYISLSSGLSASYENALLAKHVLKEKYPDTDVMVVDSLSATGGMSIFVERAVKNLSQGMSLEDNYRYLDMMKGHVHVWFFVQDINYLKRSGRVNQLIPAMGGLLNMKPILMTDHLGKIAICSNKRGTQKAIQEMIGLFKEFDDGGNDVIYVVDADDRANGDDTAKLIEQIRPKATIRRKTLSPIVGAHTGPGLVAVCHVGKKK